MRQRVVEHMCSIAAMKSAPVSSKTQILKFLAMHAFFAVDKSAVGKVCHASHLLSYVALYYNVKG